MKTPLYDQHIQLSAKMAGFAGFEMPIYYSSIKQEHLLVRNEVAMFDTTHMGVVKLVDSQESLVISETTLLMRKIGDMQQGDIRYNRIINDQGGVVDDILVYRRQDDFIAVFNASNVQKDIDFFKSRSIIWELLDLHIIAIQGPKAAEILSDSELNKLGYYKFIEKELFGIKVLVSRTGYTGEDGFEIMSAAADCATVWQKLSDLGVQPAGLGARDSLRIEAGMPLYGHELKDEWSSKKSNTVMGLKMSDRGMLQEGASVLNGDQKIGVITSATFSPVLNCSIGIFMPENGIDTGQNVQVDIRGRQKHAEVVKLPFINKNR